MDIPLLGVPGDPQWNVGNGFPTKKMFLDEVIPMLNLNHHNPEFSKEETPVSGGNNHYNTYFAVLLLDSTSGK